MKTSSRMSSARHRCWLVEGRELVEVDPSTQARSLAEDKHITSVGKRCLVDLRIYSKSSPGVSQRPQHCEVLVFCWWTSFQTHLKATGGEIASQILELMTGVALDAPLARSDRDGFLISGSDVAGRLTHDFRRSLGTSYCLEDLARRSCGTLSERIPWSREVIHYEVEIGHHAE